MFSSNRTDTRRRTQRTAPSAGGITRRMLVLTIAVAMAVMMAAPATADGSAPWPLPEGDAQATGQSATPGPDDPGVLWHLDLSTVETPYAPEGYSTRQQNLLVSSDGVLVLRVNNRDEQYESARFNRELVGIDGDTGELLYQIGNVSTTSQRRCEPAIDSQDRVWIEQREGRTGDRYVRAFDASTGTSTGVQFNAEDDRCRDQMLIGGATEHLVYAAGGDPGSLRLFNISGSSVNQTPTDLFTLEGVSSMVNQSSLDAWGVFTDDAFLTVVEFVENEDTDDESRRLEVVAISLDDGNVADRIEMPTPQGASSGDYGAAHLLLDGDTLVVSPVSSRGDDPGAFIAGIDVSGSLSVAWETPLEDEPNDLTLGDGVVLVQEGNRTTLGGPPLKAISTATGEVAFDGGVRGGTEPLTNPDGGGYTTWRIGSMTRDQLITHFTPDGQVGWFIRPESIVAALDGIDDRDDLNMGNRFAQVHMAAVGDDGTLFLTSGAGQGILALDNSGGLAEIPMPFPDVDESSVHAPNIAQMAHRGITEGDADGNYNPDGLVTRAQFATFLVRALGIDPVDEGPFTDVDPGSVHAPNINAAAEAEITTGVTATTFEPARSITRAQVASLLARAFGLEGVEEGPFVDVDPDSVHAPNINAVAEAEITTGTTATTFNPDGEVTRAQMASLLIRALDSQDE